MPPLAHVGGVPVEELVPAAAGVGTALLLARTWLALWLRRGASRERAVRVRVASVCERGTSPTSGGRRAGSSGRRAGEIRGRDRASGKEFVR